MAKAKAVEPQEETTTTGFVNYITADKEVGTYSILVSGQNIDGLWDNKREKLIFEVPAELEERFKLHHHVVSGRIIKVK